MDSKVKFFLVILVTIFVATSSQWGAAATGIDVNCTMKPGGAEEEAIKHFKKLVEELNQNNI